MFPAAATCLCMASSRLSSSSHLAHLVPIPKEYFIPVPEHLLRKHLVERLEKSDGAAQANRFVQFCELLQGIYHQRALEVRSTLKRHYLHAGLQGRLRVAERTAEMVSVASQVEEDEFIDGFFAIMEKANYALLNQGEWDVAMGENFTFHADVQIEWEKMHPGVLQRFYDGHPETREHAYFQAERCTLFHRGVGEAVSHRRFIGEKTDLLLEYAVCALHGFLGSPCGRRREDAVGSSRGSAESEVQYVCRETLRHMLPSFGAVCRNFFTCITIREPTFRDVVLLYYADSDPNKDCTPAVKAKDNRESPSFLLTGFAGAFPRDSRGPAAMPEGHVAGTANKCISRPAKQQGLEIKSFHSIPMADLEMIFPYKTVRASPREKAQLGVTLLLALVAFRQMYYSHRGSFVVVVMVVMRCMQIYRTMQRAKQSTATRMTAMLYSKSLDSGLGVVHDLIDQMEEQEVKEVILSYWALLTSEGPGERGQQSELEIDERCERLLLKDFGVTVDFEVKDALEKLVGDGLAALEPATGGEKKAGGEAKRAYRAAPLEAALARLRGLWRDFYEGCAKGASEPLEASPLARASQGGTSPTRSHAASGQLAAHAPAAHQLEWWPPSCLAAAESTGGAAADATLPAAAAAGPAPLPLPSWREVIADVGKAEEARRMHLAGESWQRRARRGSFARSWPTARGGCLVFKKE